MRLSESPFVTAATICFFSPDARRVMSH